MRELSEKLLSLVQAAELRLRQISERGSIQPILPGGWSRKQVIGHLIDSTSNNHQRFVRAVLQTSWISLATTRAEACECKLFKALIGNSWSRCGLRTIAT